MTLSKGWFAAPLLAAMLVAGCTGVIDGNARPAAGLVPRPVRGKSVEQVLPQREQLSQMLDQPLMDSVTFPPLSGGIDDMNNGLFSSPKNAPRECGGVAGMLQQNPYRGSSVQNFAEHFWDTHRELVKVTVVRAGAVALAAATDADALFAKFSQQWTGCDGKAFSVFDQEGELDGTRKIFGVRAADSIVSARLQTTLSDGVTILTSHAVGVRVNCVVEVQVGFNYEYRSPALSGTGDPDTSAVQIAHAMMDKVSELSQ